MFGNTIALLLTLLLTLLLLSPNADMNQMFINGTKLASVYEPGHPLKEFIRLTTVDWDGHVSAEKLKPPLFTPPPLAHDIQPSQRLPVSTSLR